MVSAPAALPPDGRKNTEINMRLFVEEHQRDKKHLPRPPEHDRHDHTVLDKFDAVDVARGDDNVVGLVTPIAVVSAPAALPPDGPKNTEISGKLFIDEHLRDKEHLPRPPEHDG